MKCKASTRPAGERVTFLCLCKEKSPKESTPQVARSPGILPSDFASGLRGSLSAHPCARSALARILRAPLRAFSAAPCDARHRERRRFFHESVHPCTALRNRSPLEKPSEKKRSASSCFCFCGRMPPKRGPLWRGEGAQEKPEGWRAGCAPVRCAHMDVRSTDPGAASRSRRAGCPKTASPGVCFFGYFLCTSKESDPLAAGEWKLCTSKARSTWIPACAGMTSVEKSWIPAYAGMTS